MVANKRCRSFARDTAKSVDASSQVLKTLNGSWQVSKTEFRKLRPYDSGSDHIPIKSLYANVDQVAQLLIDFINMTATSIRNGCELVVGSGTTSVLRNACVFLSL